MLICAVKWLPPFVLINEPEKGLTNKNHIIKKLCKVKNKHTHANLSKRQVLHFVL